MTDYLEKHKRNLKVITTIINDNNERQKDLSKINSNRDKPIPVNKDDDAFVLRHNRNKLKPLYQKHAVKTDLENKIETNKGTYHKKIVKPKRKVINDTPSVSDDDTSTTHSTPGVSSKPN